MKQSEVITAGMGTGAVQLRECSNTPGIAIPNLTLMQPASVDPETGHITPAASMELSAKQVDALYKLLRSYYQNT